MNTGQLFPFTQEHEMIQQTARDFAQKEIVPIAAEFDESGEFPSQTIKKMGEMGFMGIEVPEEYGGAGMDTLAYVLALEEICKADAAHGTIMSVNNSLCLNSARKHRSRSTCGVWRLGRPSAPTR
jgi:alkylation response protein AidB-like acyl-CoA dehydrogenase